MLAMSKTFSIWYIYIGVANRTQLSNQNCQTVVAKHYQLCQLSNQNIVSGSKTLPVAALSSSKSLLPNTYSAMQRVIQCFTA